MTINDAMFWAAVFPGYIISDQAVNSGDTAIRYAGFLNKKGEWYILKQDTSAGSNSLQEFRYAKGASAYPTAFASRESLTYDYVSVTFA